MSKQFAISAAASIFAMASFALLAPDSARLADISSGAVGPVVLSAELPEAPTLDMPVPNVPGL